MSLHSCPECWNVLCDCGHMYKDRSTQNMIELITGIIKNRKDKVEILDSLKVIER